MGGEGGEDRDRDSATEPWSWLSVVSLFICCVSPATRPLRRVLSVYKSFGIVPSSGDARIRQRRCEDEGSKDARMKEAKMRG